MVQCPRAWQHGRDRMAYETAVYVHALWRVGRIGVKVVGSRFGWPCTLGCEWSSGAPRRLSGWPAGEHVAGLAGTAWGLG